MLVGVVRYYKKCSIAVWNMTVETEYNIGRCGALLQEFKHRCLWTCLWRQSVMLIGAGMNAIKVSTVPVVASCHGVLLGQPIPVSIRRFWFSHVSSQFSSRRKTFQTLHIDARLAMMPV